MKYLLLLLSLNLFSVEHIVKFNSSLEKSQIKSLELNYNLNLRPFSVYQKGYFKNLFISTNKKSKLESIPEIISIEDNIQIKALSLTPSNKLITNDPLSSYQWALDNNGHTVSKDLDDITSFTITSNPKAIINIPYDIDNFLIKDTVIAILDSGIDISHEDLQENLYKNHIECNNGKIPFRPKEDKDNNGYIGDCLGWDFTGKNKDGDNKPDDDIGHGTHIAGIISATKNNELGITGLSNRIKILPIKVLSNSNDNENALGLSDRIAQGILYAISRNVDVINLSLGWPKILDKNHLREAVNEAIRNGITVVAAAGNNNHDSPIFPCAYEKVICVGSIDLDMKISNFSNFGSHVDILAPGGDILSTFPESMDPILFSIQKYELKSGTSQAAPYISAAIALLKSKDPTISANEIKRRIYSTSKNIIDKRKYISNGLVDITASITTPETKFLYPVLKNLNNIKIDKRLKALFNIKLSNLGEKIDNAVIKINSSNPNLVFTRSTFYLSNISKDTEKELELELNAKDLKSESTFYLTLSIEYEGKKHTYKRKLFLTRRLSEIDNKKTLVINNKDNKILNLKTIDTSIFAASNPDYYYESQDDKTGLSVTILKTNSAKIDSTLIFNYPKAEKLLSIQKHDINYDGNLDYWIRVVEKDNNQSKIVHYLYDQYGSKLFDQYTKWELDFEGQILDTYRSVYIKYNHKELGNISLPFFMAQGNIPKYNENPDPFEADKSSRVRLFYLFPIIKNGIVKLQTRIIDDYKYINNLEKALSINFPAQLSWLNLGKQNEQDFYNNNAWIYFSAGNGFLKENYRIQISNIDNSGMKISKLDRSTPLAGYEYDRIIDLNTTKTDDNIFIGAHRNDLWEIFNLNTKSESFIKQTDLSEKLLFHISSWKNDFENIHLFQTTSQLRFFHKNKNQIFSYDVHVSSFLSGEVFKETFYPITFNKTAALYIDSTQISSDNVYVLRHTDRGISKINIETNIQMDPGCRPKNPVLINDKLNLAFQCNKSKKLELVYYELN